MKGFASALLFLGAGLAAYGDSASFNFNSLTPGATNATISTYMTGVLQAAGCIGCSVSVTDGSTGYVYVDSTYAGDNHVVGPGGSPDTLGTTDGALNNNAKPNSTYDNFLSNVSNGASSGGNQIDLSFTLPKGYTMSGIVGFDFEIFPDAGCASAGSCTVPSIEFEAGLGSVSPVTSFGTGGTRDAVAPSSSSMDGSSTESGALHTETADQWIGTFSTPSGLASYNQLDFIDWPTAIGIDNLTVNFTPPVPEPKSILLLATLCLLLVPMLRRLRQA